MAERKKYDYEDSRLKAQKFVRYKEGCKLYARQKGIHRNNYLNCWESVIKQYRNGSVEFPQQKDIRNNP